MDITINLEKNTAIFCGPGTFEAKDEIKRLGVASWSSQLKAWKVRNLSVSLESLKKLFPDAIFIESENTIEETRENNSQKNSTTKSNDGVPSGFSVPELLSKIRLTLRQAFPGNIFVYGVLSSVKQSQEGRVYIELTGNNKASDSISCVIWDNANEIIKPLQLAGFKLEPELEIMFEVRVDLNSRCAGISLNIIKIVPEYTISKLIATREMTNERLKKENLFDKNKKTILPFLPKRLGLLTSAGGTVIHDFRAALDLANFDFELYWSDVSVQGTQAKREIIQGLRNLIKIPNLDAILIFRGGGSPGDLAIFNDYEVCKEVCLCPLPVISAIGHQEDQSSLQDVSFLALGVPKDIGHYFANLVNQLRVSYSEFTKIIINKSTQLLELFQQRIIDFNKSLSSLSLKIIMLHEERLIAWRSTKEARVSGMIQRVEDKLIIRLNHILDLSTQSISRFQETFKNIGSALSRNISHAIEKQFHRLRIGNDIIIFTNNKIDSLTIKTDSLERIIKESSPEVQLRRGFSLVKIAKTDNYVLSGENLKVGEEIEIEFHDKIKLAEIKG